MYKRCLVFWVAVKAHKLIYHNSETIFFGIDPGYGDLICVSQQQPSF